jgi:hypothetical protein
LRPHREKSESEIRADTQRILRDPAMKELIKRSRAPRARGESVRLEDFVKDAGTVKGGLFRPDVDRRLTTDD